MKPYQLVLGSQSPRRIELLSSLGIPFRQEISKANEVSDSSKPEAFALDIARIKAFDLVSSGKVNLNNDFLLTADTIVIVSDRILGKPKDQKEWREYLELLSNRTHQVITAVTLSFESFAQEFYVETKVTFSSIDEHLLKLYLATNDGLDKAGGYGVQGMGQLFIKKIEGSYSNVVGLPISEVYESMIKMIVKSGRSLDQFFDYGR
jgi:septum formation protein